MPLLRCVFASLEPGRRTAFAFGSRRNFSAASVILQGQEAAQPYTAKSFYLGWTQWALRKARKLKSNCAPISSARITFGLGTPQFSPATPRHLSTFSNRHFKAQSSRHSHSDARP